MAQRRHHYEHAFEEYLRVRRIPYVAVDEARKALLPQSRPTQSPCESPADALKSFDFVIYGQGANLLIEVKGRKLSARRDGTGRLECWVTRDDLDSLSRWQGLFGPEFQAAFVFIYWCDQQPPDALFQEIFEHRGRWYALRAVLVRDYLRAMRVRSNSWRTVDLPPRDFERLSVPFAPASATSPGHPGLNPAAPLQLPLVERLVGV